MPETQVIATRTNLMRAKQDLHLATEGHRLLDQKREVLILELLQVLTRLREQARKARGLIEKGYAAIDDAELSMGQLGLYRAGEGPIETPSTSAVERSVMGVVVPSLGLNKKSRGPEGGLGETAPEMAEGAEVLTSSVAEIVKWAELDLTVFRLAAEVKKTQRRVNALGEMFIPETRELIAKISASLEEAEREEFFRRKRVKSKLRQRKQEEESEVA